MKKEVKKDSKKVKKKHYREVILKKRTLDGKIFCELVKVDSSIVRETEYALENKDIVFAYKEKDILKIIYLFETVQSENEKILVFKKAVHTPDVSEEDLNKIENNICEDLGADIAMNELQRVEWGDKEIVPTRVKIGKYEIGTTALILISTLAISVFTDEIVLPISIGILLVLTCGYTIYKK